MNNKNVCLLHNMLSVKFLYNLVLCHFIWKDYFRDWWFFIILF